MRPVARMRTPSLTGRGFAGCAAGRTSGRGRAPPGEREKSVSFRAVGYRETVCCIMQAFGGGPSRGRAGSRPENPFLEESGREAPPRSPSARQRKEEETHGTLRRRMAVHCSADHRDRACTPHEGGALVAPDRHPRGHAHLHDRYRRQRHHGDAADHLHPDGQQGGLQHPHLHLAPRGARLRGRHVGRHEGLRHLGGRAREEPPRDAHVHDGPRHPHLHRRLLQLPLGRHRDAPALRPRPGLAREARLHHRLDRGSDLHHRPRLLLGRGRGVLSQGQRRLRIRHGRLHRLDPMELLRAPLDLHGGLHHLDGT